MNKKILSIFVMIMALSLFGVSCSNEDSTGTGGNNSGTTGGSGTPAPTPTPTPTPNPKPTPTQVDQNTIASALKVALGTTISVNKTDNKTMKTDQTSVTLEDGKINITITDTALNAANNGVKTDAVASFTKIKDKFKEALVSQGLEAATGDITFAGTAATKTLDITVGGAKVSSKTTDAAKFTLPDTLKDKDAITITLKLVLGDSGTWK